MSLTKSQFTLPQIKALKDLTFGEESLKLNLVLPFN